MTNQPVRPPRPRPLRDRFAEWTAKNAANAGHGVTNAIVWSNWFASDVFKSDPRPYQLLTLDKSTDLIMNRLNELGAASASTQVESSLEKIGERLDQIAHGHSEIMRRLDLLESQ